MFTEFERTSLHTYRVVQKNGTQTTLNNFFVIWPLTLQFTHIIIQHVQFMYLKGFYDKIKSKKVMDKTQKGSICLFYIEYREISPDLSKILFEIAKFNIKFLGN